LREASAISTGPPEVSRTITISEAVLPGTESFGVVEGMPFGLRCAEAHREASKAARKNTTPGKSRNLRVNMTYPDPTLMIRESYTR